MEVPKFSYKELRESVSLFNDNSTDEVLCWERYKAFEHFRHDILHVFICKALFSKPRLGTVETTRSYLESKGVFSEEWSDLDRLTPDINLYNKNKEKMLILDVTCTHNVAMSREEKKRKYTGLVEFCKNTLKIDTVFHTVALHPSLTHLYHELEKIPSTDWFPVVYNDEMVLEYKSQHMAVEKAMNQLKQRIPDSYFTDRGRIESSKVHMTEFKPNVYKNMESSYHNSILGYDYGSLPDAELEFMKLTEDQDIIHKLSDKAHTPMSYERGFSEIHDKDRQSSDYAHPTLHIPFCPYEEGIVQVKNVSEDLPTEQRYILSMLDCIRTIVDPEMSGEIALVKHILAGIEECVENPLEKNFFNTGYYTGSREAESKLKEEYANICNTTNNKSKKNFNNKSFRSFLINDRGYKIKENLPYIDRNKTVRINLPVDENSKNFLRKSGTSYKKYHPEGRVYSDPDNCKKECSNDMEVFFHMLTEYNRRPLKVDEQLLEPVGRDSQACSEIKSLIKEELVGFMTHLNKYKVSSLAKYTHEVSTQLLHFNELNTTENSFNIINGGHPNMLHIVQGGSLNKGNDVGQAFFSCFFTTDQRWCSSVFGRVKHTVVGTSQTGNTIYFCCTNWRRIPSYKLSFIRDQYYSTLSTAFDTWQRVVEPRMDIGNHDFLMSVYVFRLVVSYCTSQRLAEILLDIRYLIMSCFSEFAAVHKLIPDKFGPPYPNALSRWVIDQLEMKCVSIHQEVKGSRTIVPNRPGFSGVKRIHNTLGGTIDVQGLWSNFRYKSLQDLFDAIFVYVHTIKEPSSIYHESIKAVNTINKYQTEYDALTSEAQHGQHTFDTFKNLILHGGTVGCWSKFCYWSSSILSERYKAHSQATRLIEMTQSEPVSEIVSTKACIPENFRSITDVEVPEEEVIKNKNDFENLLRSGLLDKRENYISLESAILKKRKKIEVDPKYTGKACVTSKSARAKVHDTVLDFTMNYPDTKTVLDIANWNMSENGGSVCADICIKAQYGAKREFYVLNLGAKAMARVLENSFKFIAEFLPQEMISVPGDLKLKFMQEMVNDVITQSISQDDELYYVNGDCTKWSNCETMASFIAMSHGWKGILGEELTSFCVAVFSLWANKKITIPLILVDKIRFIGKKTEYIKETAQLKSTHNFLQGMFNYSSSVKAVCATEFAIYMWRKYNPDKPVYCRHLEHSDDYSLIIRVRDVEHFKQFRVYHKLSQRMHGINDSEKKTNCQRHFMEFISLMSFNGQMAYPNIKKTKEIGVNVACTGYVGDAMAIVSRSGECIRMGVPISSAYVLQVLHSIYLRKTYSIGECYTNKIPCEVNPRDLPIELFGVPDCLPIAYCAAKGNPNTYRIMKYCDERILSLLKGLFIMSSLVNIQESQTEGDDPIALMTLYHPKYSYIRNESKLKRIRERLDIKQEDRDLFWEEHKSYNFCKPTNTQLMLKWLSLQYYNRSFAQAYTQLSRSKLALRLSMFASKKCLSFKDINPEQLDNYYTLQEGIKVLFELAEKYSQNYDKKYDSIFLKTVLSGETNIEAFYSYMDDAAIIDVDDSPLVTTVSNLPRSYCWLELENHYSTVLQYMFNQEDMILDGRRHNGYVSLERDKESVIKTYSIKAVEDVPLQLLKVIFKDLTILSKRVNVGLTYSSDTTLYDKYISSYIENGTFFKRCFKVVPKGTTSVHNPITSQTIYQRDWRFVKDIEFVAIEQLSLMYMLCVVKLQLDLEIVRRWMIDTEIQELGITIQDFFQNTTIDSLQGKGSDDAHLKSFAFLSRFLFNNTNNLTNYVTSRSFYKHSYNNVNWDNGVEEVSIQYLGKNFVATTLLLSNSKYLAGDLKYMNQTQLADLSKDRNNTEIIVRTSTGNIAGNVSAYFIAEKLFGRITQKVLSQKLSNLPLNSIPMISQYTNLVIDSTLYSGTVMVVNDATLIPTPLSETKEKKFLPIIKVVNIPYSHKIAQSSLVQSYSIDFQNASVSIGDLKLFTLPFLQFGSFNVLKFNKQLVCKHININNFVTQKYMWDYLHQETSSRPRDLIKDNIYTMDEESFFDIDISRVNCLCINSEEVFKTDKTDLVPQSDLVTLRSNPQSSDPHVRPRSAIGPGTFSFLNLDVEVEDNSSEGDRSSGDLNKEQELTKGTDRDGEKVTPQFFFEDMIINTDLDKSDCESIPDFGDLGGMFGKGKEKSMDYDHVGEKDENIFDVMSSLKNIELHPIPDLGSGSLPIDDNSAREIEGIGAGSMLKEGFFSFGELIDSNNIELFIDDDEEDEVKISSGTSSTDFSDINEDKHLEPFYLNLSSGYQSTGLSYVLTYISNIWDIEKYLSYCWVGDSFISGFQSPTQYLQLISLIRKATSRENKKKLKLQERLAIKAITDAIPCDKDMRCKPILLPNNIAYELKDGLRLRMLKVQPCVDEEDCKSLQKDFPALEPIKIKNIWYVGVKMKAADILNAMDDAGTPEYFESGTEFFNILKNIAVKTDRNINSLINYMQSDKT